MIDRIASRTVNVTYRELCKNRLAARESVEYKCGCIGYREAWCQFHPLYPSYTPIKFTKYSGCLVEFECNKPSPKRRVTGSTPVQGAKTLAPTTLEGAACHKKGLTWVLMSWLDNPKRQYRIHKPFTVTTQQKLTILQLTPLRHL